MGHACYIPSFWKAGLRLKTLWDEEDSVENLAESVVIFRGAEGIEAASQFFGIGLNEAELLFGAEDGNPTPKQVARRLRKFAEQAIAD